MAKVAVIGAGITGITTAYYLARAGNEVSVFDLYPFPAWGTSYSNGGQLSVSNSQVWNTWPTVLKGLKWMFDPAAPLLINPKPTWPKIKWIAGFLLTTALGHATKNTLKTVDMALRARQLYKEIEQEENIKFDHGNHGIIVIEDYMSRRHTLHAYIDLLGAINIALMLSKQRKLNQH
jgi:D-amino-acid dehydrogenase